MDKPNFIKHLTGYLLGSFVFLILIPFLIYLASLISPGSLDFNISAVKFFNYSVAAILSAAGIVFVIWSNVDLLVVGKGGPTDFFNKSISPRSKKLVTKGPYRYSRNPMVFGMNALYIALSIFLNSGSSLLFCLLFLSAVILYLKLTEEKRLIRDFEDEYLEYKRKVSMILPLPPKRA